MSPFPKPETGWFSVTPRAGCCASPPAQAPETGARAAARLRARRCAFPSRPWNTTCRTYSRSAKTRHEPIADVRVKLRTVFRQVYVVRPIRVCDTGVERLHVLRAQKRLERGIQPPADPLPALILAQVDAHLGSPGIGRARTERAGVGVADDLSAAHGDQIRIAPECGAHACGEFFDIRHGALKRDGRLFHVGCIDRAQRGRVAQTRGAQMQGVRVHTFFTFRCRRSLRARARTGRSHRSRPMPCSASRSRTPCAPDRDSTARRAHGRAATPW